MGAVLGFGVAIVLLGVSCPAWGAETISVTELRQLAEKQKVVLDLGVPLDLPPNKIAEMVREIIERSEAGVKKILALPADRASFSNTVEAYDSLQNEFSKINTYVKLVVALASGTPAGVEAAKQRDLLEEWHSRTTADARLQARIKRFQTVSDLEPIQQRLIAVILDSFDVPPTKSEEVVDAWELAGVQQELGRRESRFSEILMTPKVLQFASDELRGVPKEFLSQFGFDRGTYSVDVSQSWQWEAVLSHAESAETRARVWKAIHSSSEEAEKLVEIIRTARRRVAKHVGHRSWTDYNNSGHSITPRAVQHQLLSAIRQTDAGFRKEKREIGRLLGHSPAISDIYFAAEKKKEQLGFSEEVVKEYFPLESVRSGMFALAGKAFGINVREVSDFSPWAQGKLYVVSDTSTGNVLGTFVHDPYAREGKDPWFMAHHQTASKLLPDGARQRPFAVLHTSFPPMEAGAPTLLRFEDVWTLFHEFGHVLHFLLNAQPYHFLAPDEANADLCEFGSTLLERMAWDPQTIRSVGRHWKTGETIPDDLVTKIEQSRNYFGIHRLRRMGAQALLDLKIHAAKRLAIGPLQEQAYGVYYPLPEGVNVPARSTHFQDYSATYWTYLWSDALAEEEYRKFKAASSELWNPEEGMRFRRLFFEAGVNEASKELMDKIVGKKFRFCPSILLAVQKSS